MITIFDQLEVKQGVDKDDGHKARCDELPTKPPVQVWIKPKHEFNVSAESVNSVNVTERVEFSDGQDESDE